MDSKEQKSDWYKIAKWQQEADLLDALRYQRIAMAKDGYVLVIEKKPNGLERAVEYMKKKDK